MRGIGSDLLAVLVDRQRVQSPSEDRLSSPSIMIIFHTVAKRCDVFICKSPLSVHLLLRVL